MPTYSSAQFYEDWRYCVEKDFTNPSGEPVKYAQDGLRTWGSEWRKLSFSKCPTHAAVNCDASLIAISVEDDIHVHATTDFSQVLILKGHVSQIDGLAFQPRKPKILVSSAQNHRGGSVPAEPTIIIWDLDKQGSYPSIDDSVISDIASKATQTISLNLLETQHQLELSATESESLTSEIEPLISRIIKTHSISNNRTIHGRLGTSFQSEVFSPSGSHMIYLPANRPRSNSNAIWDIKIYSMATHEDILTLSGHYDAIIWTGYSPNERLIGTVAWDKSMRIWDAATGQQKYKFNTTQQNWTGGFSPNSQMFAGTCGNGTFYVYSMNDGSTLVEEKLERGYSWTRALSWSADNKTLAMGTGKFFLYGVEKKAFTQERILSKDKSKMADELKRFGSVDLECVGVRFVDGGRKVVVQTSGDCGIETYDLETWEKWRFARPGVDEELGGEISKDSDGTLVRGGYEMTVWEYHKRGKILIANMYSNAMRIWDVPMSKGGSQL
jgi:WD40 repeat protein